MNVRTSEIDGEARGLRLRLRSSYLLGGLDAAAHLESGTRFAVGGALLVTAGKGRGDHGSLVRPAARLLPQLHLHLVAASTAARMPFSLVQWASEIVRAFRSQANVADRRSSCSCTSVGRCSHCTTTRVKQPRLRLRV